MSEKVKPFVGHSPKQREYMRIVTDHPLNLPLPRRTETLMRRLARAEKAITKLNRGERLLAVDRAALRWVVADAKKRLRGSGWAKKPPAA